LDTSLIHNIPARMQTSTITISCMTPFFFFFNAPAPTQIYTLSLHDALPISVADAVAAAHAAVANLLTLPKYSGIDIDKAPSATLDRKSTRLNSSHRTISYAVFCLKKKNITRTIQPTLSRPAGTDIIINTLRL